MRRKLVQCPLERIRKPQLPRRQGAMEGIKLLEPTAPSHSASLSTLHV
ncbi:hypothetical protein PHLH4_41180 [Pseudomonas sp. St316]|nr:hypothetical protein PHLH4_41180 [Pseudomonas sp. St316]